MTRELPDTVDLGESQLALLEDAVAAGYFSVPRETTLVDLAAAHDISTKEASRLLRTTLQQVLTPLFEDNEQAVTGARSAELAALFSESVPDEATPELLFSGLAAKQRRWVLYYLRQRSPVSRSELTDIVLGWQAGESGPLGPSARPSVDSTLEQLHLPLLDAAGLVSFDDERVRLEPLSDAEAELLDAARRIDEESGSPAAAIPVAEQGSEDR